MVGAIPKKLPAFLRRVHQINRASGSDELARAAGITPRSAQRWHQAFKDLTYFPNAECEALGLVHIHLFLLEPRGNWNEWPYGVQAQWVVRERSVPMLYVHSLVPREHEGEIRKLLAELCEEGWMVSVEVVATRDAWQVFERNDATVAIRRAAQNAWDMIERYPLVLPVLFEMMEHRRTIPDVWQAIRQRLGKRVWQYLPDGVEVLPHNGKRYVTEALRLVNENYLVRQHIVRFPSQYMHTMDVLATIPSSFSEILHLAGNDAPLQEIFPISEHEHLVRLTGTVNLLRRILKNRSVAHEWWFVDNDTTPPPARFAYELLFDPATTEWRFPRDEIKRRIAR